MKKILLSLVVLLTALQSLPAQDSLYVQYANRFQANRYLFSTVGLDSLEFFARSAMPIIRRYSNQYSAGYNDYRVNNLVNSDGTSNGMLVFGDPGLILWKPTTSDQSYNNDYTVETNRWTFKRSKESEHFVVFWDRMFGDHPNASTVPSDCRVDIDDLLKKAEIPATYTLMAAGVLSYGEPHNLGMLGMHGTHAANIAMQRCDLLIAADCTAYAYAAFHERFIKGHITLVGCPKLDSVDYSEKLTEIIRENNIRSVTVVRMEVPCCGGLELAAKKALQQSGKFIPWQVVTVTVDGRLVEE